MQSTATKRHVDQSDDSLFGSSSPSSTSNPSSTFAIRVVSYDTSSDVPTVTGTKLSNDQTVTVSLRSDISADRIQKREKGGVSIKNFAKKRKLQTDPSVEPGGVLLVQDARETEENVWGAAWMSALSKTPDEANVFEAVVHVTPVQPNKNGKIYSRMTVIQQSGWNISPELEESLKIDGPILVKSADQLQKVLQDILSDGLNVGFRITEAGGRISALTVGLYDGRLKANVTPEVATRNFMNTYIKQNIADAIKSGSMTAEIIPISGVFAGPMTIPGLQNNKVNQNRLALFQTEAETKDGKPYIGQVFQKSIVAIRLNEEIDKKTGMKGAYFTFVHPLYPVAIGLKDAIKYAQTDASSPELPDLSYLDPRNKNTSRDADVPSEAHEFGSDYVDETNNAIESAMKQHETSEEDVVPAEVRRSPRLRD